jgi:CRP-like cAMP-binding protein
LEENRMNPALADSHDPADIAAAEAALRGFTDDPRPALAGVRAEVARALSGVANPSFRGLLVPLMFDADVTVAREAIRSAGRLGAGDALFLPPLVSLLRHRQLKAAARDVLAGYGESIVPALVYFLRDRDEDVWVRRHLPATLARIPCQASLDALVETLDTSDGFLRFKALTALDTLRQTRPDLAVPAARVEAQIRAETARAFNQLTLHYNLFHAGGLDRRSLLARALTEKYQRAMARVFTLLGLVHPPADIAAVRQSLVADDARARSSASEYLDNILQGPVRARVMLLVEDMPLDTRIQKGNALFRTRQRDVEDTLAQLVHDESQEVAAAAIQLVEAQRLWTLAGDLEHVLEHRPAQDWWQEPLPAVELADRLRRVPLFDFSSVDELFRIAALGRQVRHEAGQVIVRQGQAASGVHVVLDGQVTPHGAAADGAAIVVGLDDVLQGRPAHVTITAVTPTITLTMTSDAFLTLLAENVEIAQGIFRFLLESGDAPTRRAVVHGELSAELAQRVADGVQAVDGLLILQASPMLQRASAAELVRLSRVERIVPLNAGDTLFTSGAPAAIVAVLAGQVELLGDGGPIDTAHPGDVLGEYETLAGRPMTTTARVTAAGTAMRLDRGELFELLADDIPLLQGIFSGLLRASGHAATGTHEHSRA